MLFTCHYSIWWLCKCSQLIGGHRPRLSQATQKQLMWLQWLHTKHKVVNELSKSSHYILRKLHLEAFVSKSIYFKTCFSTTPLRWRRKQSNLLYWIKHGNIWLKSQCVLIVASDVICCMFARDVRGFIISEQPGARGKWKKIRFQKQTNIASNFNGKNKKNNYYTSMRRIDSLHQI